MPESQTNKPTPTRGLTLAMAAGRAVTGEGKPLNGTALGLLWALAEIGDAGKYPGWQAAVALLGSSRTAVFRAETALKTSGLVEFDGPHTDRAFRLTVTDAPTAAQDRGLGQWFGGKPPVAPASKPRTPRRAAAESPAPNPQPADPADEAAPAPAPAADPVVAPTPKPTPAAKPAPAAKPPAKAAKPKLTDEAKTWFVSHPDQMDLYLRFGAGAAGKSQAQCEQTLKPGNTDWLMFVPQPRGPQDVQFPFREGWQATHLMGYYWSGVNHWRARKGMELAFPQWDRLAGEIKKALATGTVFQAYSRIYTVIQHFDLIRWRIGKLGEDLMLDEVTLNHRLVMQQSAQLIARTGPEGEQWMYDQYHRMNQNLPPNED